MQADVTFFHGNYVLGNDPLVYGSETLLQVNCSLLNVTTTGPAQRSMPWPAGLNVFKEKAALGLLTQTCSLFAFVVMHAGRGP